MVYLMRFTKRDKILQGWSNQLILMVYNLEGTLKGQFFYLKYTYTTVQNIVLNKPFGKHRNTKVFNYAVYQADGTA